MIHLNKGRSISFFISLFVIISFSGCNELLDKLIIPRSAVISTYQSAKFYKYNLKTIALIPMSPDDTTDQGTFYATNHFLNRLKEKYPDIFFTVPNVDSLINSDSLIVNKTIDSIEKLKHLEMQNFLKTDFGYAITEYEPDAMIIGRINKVTYKTGLSIGGTYGRINATQTSCDFTYYIISLIDGRVLWKANVVGEGGYELSSKDTIYVPLDIAISNGIDKMINKIPSIVTSAN